MVHIYSTCHEVTLQVQALKRILHISGVPTDSCVITQLDERRKEEGEKGLVLTKHPEVKEACWSGIRYFWDALNDDIKFCSKFRVYSVEPPWPRCTLGSSVYLHQERYGNHGHSFLIFFFFWWFHFFFHDDGDAWRCSNFRDYLRLSLDD